jgi:hypothetical protein
LPTQNALSPYFAKTMTLELNSIGFSTFVVSIVLSFLATLAVAIRFYTRGKLNNGLGLDDWLILASLPFFYLYVVDVLYGARAHTFPRK